jgi:hypothetical protein
MANMYEFINNPLKSCSAFKRKVNSTDAAFVQPASVFVIKKKHKTFRSHFSLNCQCKYNKKDTKYS